MSKKILTNFLTFKLFFCFLALSFFIFGQQSIPVATHSSPKIEKLKVPVENTITYSVEYSTITKKQSDNKLEHLITTAPDLALTSLIQVFNNFSNQRKFPAILNPASKARASPVHI